MPTAASPAWNAAQKALCAALTRDGLAMRVRSPSSLWRFLRGSPLPRGATWGNMLRGGGWSQLTHALVRNCAGNGRRIASWSARWLVSTTTAQGAAKRAT